MGILYYSHQKEGTREGKEKQEKENYIYIYHEKRKEKEKHIINRT